MIERKTIEVNIPEELPFKEGETLHAWAARATEVFAPGWTLENAHFEVEFHRRRVIGQALPTVVPKGEAGTILVARRELDSEKG